MVEAGALHISNLDCLHHKTLLNKILSIIPLAESIGGFNVGIGLCETGNFYPRFFYMGHPHSPPDAFDYLQSAIAGYAATLDRASCHKCITMWPQVTSKQVVGNITMHTREL